MSSRILTAFFDSRSDAERAVERLVAVGIPRDRISSVPDKTEVQADRQETVGFWAAIKDLFLPDDARNTYAEGLRRGGILVTAQVDEAMGDQAMDVFEECGAVDLDERETAWRQEGWTGSANLEASERELRSNTGSVAGAGATLRTGAEAEEVIPIAEEQVQIGKRDVSQGRVRVRSYIVERPVSEQVSLREEHVSVERRPATGAAESGEPFRERTIEVEEKGEEAVVAKTSRVTEEVVVRKDVRERSETVSDSVRRTEVEVDDARPSGREGVSREKTGKRAGS